MPAPARTKPWTLHSYPIECPRGIVGVYTDKEVDALLEGAGIIPVDMSQFPTKTEVAATYATKAELAAAVLGGTVDLSSYSTTVQIAAIYATQAELAKVYTKAEVDAIIAAIPTGTVDLSSYATKVSLTEAVADLTAQIVARYTKDEVDALLAAIPAGESGPITVHAGDVPTPAGPPTPASMIAIWQPFAAGLHLFAASGSLASISRETISGGSTQLNLAIIAPRGNTIARLSDFVPPPGTPDSPKSWAVTQAGGDFMRVEASAPTDTLAPVGTVDVFQAATLADVTAAIAGVQVGTLSPEQIQSIVDAVVASGFDLSNYYDKTEVDALAKTLSDQAAVWDQGVVDQYSGELRLVAATLGDAIALKADKKDTYTKREADLAAEAQIFFQSVQSNAEFDEKLAGKADKTDTYTKPEVDAAIASMPTVTQAGLVAALAGQDINVGSLSLQSTQVTFGDESAIASGGGRLLYAPNAGDPSKLETVAFASDLAGYAPLSTTTLITTQLQALFDSIYTRAESDDRYAAKTDNTQAVLAGTVVAKGYGFGDAATPPAALTYVDTNEGFGPRLVFAVGAVNDYVALRSDFEPIKARVQTLEDRTATAAPSAPPEPGSPDYYRKDIADAKFMTKDDGFSKVDMNNAMALTLYSRAQVDARLAAISPMGATSINDPAFADLRVSILSEVKKMLAGGTKMPPPDIDWTWMVRMDGSRESVSTEIQARMIGGFIELKGTLSFNAGSGSWVPLRLPPQFPFAEIDASYPLAMRLVGTAVTYGFCSVSSKSRDVSCSPGAKSSEANFSGIRWKAAY